MASPTDPSVTFIPVVIVNDSGNPVNTQTPELGPQLESESMPVVLTLEQFTAISSPKSITSVIASDGTVIPIDSLSHVYTRDVNGKITSDSVLFSSGGINSTYTQSISRDVNGNISEISEWEKQ